MNCPVCGGHIPAGATRCPQCGSRMDLADPQPNFAYASGTATGTREAVPTNPIEAFETVISKYANIDGRATRSEYWWFTLANMIVTIGLAMGGFMVHAPWIYAIYALGIFIPSLTVAIRRLHDTGRSGWWLLISLLPVLGAIILLVFTVQDSERGSNAYGPNPKGDWA